MSENPFSVPGSEATGGGSGPASLAAYQPMGLFGKVLVGVLALEWLLFLAVSVLEPIMTLGFPGALDDPGPAEMVLALAILAAGLGLIVVIIVAMPMWIYWHYRAGANQRALGRDLLTVTPGWHAGWWFVPFANLVMPYRATLELWRASEPEARHDGDEWLLSETPSWFPVWWGCWLAGNIVQNVASRLGEEASSIGGLIATPFALAALAMYIWIIKTVSENQDAIAERRTRT